MDEAISHYLRDAHQLAIGSQTAEAIKLQIGSAAPLEEELTMGVRGRHLVTGLPTEVQLHSEEVREAIRIPMQEVLRAISGTLEDTPPELAGDITREGILLAGGGTLLRGLPQLVTQHTGMSVSLADSPLTCVAIGSGLALDHFDHIATSGLPRR
jgi:rod shape-determining protein MreB